jgi:hypothetical protein
MVKKRVLSKAMHVVLLTGALAGQSLASPVPGGAPAPQPQALPLRIIEKGLFCTRLQQTFANYGAANGYDKVQVALLASGAAVQVVQEFRSGRATDFINANALAASANVPGRAPADGYLPLGAFVGQALGIGQNVTLALSTGELRFIPFAQKGTDLVVIAQNAVSLTPERAKKVAEVATQSGIHINVVWVGGSEQDPGAIGEARALAWLAAVTGGAFANLSGPGNPCAASL